MRSYDGATLAYLSGANIVAEIFVNLTAKDRGTGADEAMGFWSGSDHQTFTVGGVTQTYYGAGGVLQFPVITYTTGFVVSTHQLELSPLAPEVINAVRVYDARFAPIEIYRGFFDPADGSLIAAPHRVFRGWVDALTITTPEIGGEAGCSLTLVSAARALTRSVAQMKSDEVQKLRSGDRFRRWNAVSGTVEVSWGEKRTKAGGGQGHGGGGAGGGNGGSGQGTAPGRPGHDDRPNFYNDGAFDWSR